jgi:hypothetical protein
LFIRPFVVDENLDENSLQAFITICRSSAIIKEIALISINLSSSVMLAHSENPGMNEECFCLGVGETICGVVVTDLSI